jgi:protease secretion system membrane fusion protein
LSPATGQVVGLQVHAIGAVIGPGQKILDIVPDGEPYIIDAKIQPHIIDKLNNQQLVDIRFSGFANSPLLVVEGQIKTISKDILTQVEPSGMQQSYYLARISITKGGLKSLGDRTLQSGMPVEVIIKTGERTMLNYWLHPLLKRLAASMKEE